MSLSALRTKNCCVSTKDAHAAISPERSVTLTCSVENHNFSPCYARDILNFSTDFSPARVRSCFACVTSPPLLRCETCRFAHGLTKNGFVARIAPSFSLIRLSPFSSRCALAAAGMRRGEKERRRDIREDRVPPYGWTLGIFRTSAKER